MMISIAKSVINISSVMIFEHEPNRTYRTWLRLPWQVRLAAALPVPGRAFVLALSGDVCHDPANATRHFVRRLRARMILDNETLSLCMCTKRERESCLCVCVCVDMPFQSSFLKARANILKLS